MTIKKHFTLVEILVSISISGIILTAIYSFFATGQEAFHMAGTTVEMASTVKFVLGKVEDAFKGRPFGSVAFTARKSATLAFFEGFENYSSDWTAETGGRTDDVAAITENGYAYYCSEMKEGFALYINGNKIIYAHKYEQSGTIQYKTETLYEAELPEYIEVVFKYYDNNWDPVILSDVAFVDVSVVFIECTVSLNDGVSWHSLNTNMAVNK